MENLDMGCYVHLHVCFSCDHNDAVAALAKEMLPTLDDSCIEAKWFLQDLSKRSGFNEGPK